LSLRKLESTAGGCGSAWTAMPTRQRKQWIRGLMRFSVLGDAHHTSRVLESAGVRASYSTVAGVDDSGREG